MCHPSPSPTSIKNAAREKLDFLVSRKIGFFNVAIFCPPRRDNKGRRIPKAPTLPSFILCRRIYAPRKPKASFCCLLLFFFSAFVLDSSPIFLCAASWKGLLIPFMIVRWALDPKKRLEPHRARPGDKVRISVVLGLMHHHTSRVSFWFLQISFN